MREDITLVLCVPEEVPGRSFTYYATGTRSLNTFLP
jgi:hypothetical protein